MYRIFGGEVPHLDYSDQAKLDMYVWETKGIGSLKQDILFPANTDRRSNGFAVGKRWMSVTVAMWKQDIKAGLLFESELYREGVYPHWWLDEVLYGIKEHLG